MLGSQSPEALSSKPCQHFGVIEDFEPNVFATPVIEESEPLLSRALLASGARNSSHESNEEAEYTPKSERLDISAWPLHTLSSDLNPKARSRQHNLSTNSADSRQTAFRVGNDNGGINSGTKTAEKIPTIVFPAMFPASQKVRRSLRRSVSNPGPGTKKSQHHDPTIDSATLQQRLISQTKQTGSFPAKPWQVRRVQTATGPFQWANPQPPGRPGFRWYPVRSNSDPSSAPQSDNRPEKVRKNLPMKPCMKGRSQSAATTSPKESQAMSEGGDKPQKLRRVKTVDFEDHVSRKLLALPPLKVWTNNFALVASPHIDRSKSRGGTSGSKPVKPRSKVTSCPGPMKKSLPADAAITRTDVHVVAIAPSRGISHVPDECGIDPATPTMQLVESKSGCYEVVWDDIPLETDIRLHRKGSSASQALAAASPESSRGPRGLERVNTKLAEWTFSRRNPAEFFKSQIIVFPDDDGRAHHFDYAVEDQEDFIVIAPPNSERTSTTPSRHHSRPASTQRSKSDFFTDDEITTDEDTFEERVYNQNTLVVPDSRATSTRPGHLVGSHRRMRQPPSMRRLSNMDESDVKFRGHRDSVTLARNRIFDASSVSPELFMQKHRDSVSIAKKRMHSHTRNHAISSAREIPRPRVTASDSSHLADDLEHQSAATKALKSSSSASMLLPQPTSARHIRILE